MHHSQSNLTSLAALVEEARRTAIPPPPPGKPVDDGSGMIDLQAMEKKAREDRERASTPVPVVRTMPPVALPSIHPAASDPDFYAAVAAAKQRKKMIALGGVVASVAVLLAIGLGSVLSGASAADSAKAAAAAVAPPPPAPLPAPVPPPAPVVQTPPPAPVAVAAPAPEEPAPAKAKPGKGKGKKKARKHAGAKGPKLEKVQSAGI